MVNATRWVSRLMRTRDFYNNYDHFYVSMMKKGERKYFIYDKPPMHHRASRNRIYNYEYKYSTPTNIYYKSTELPVDWLIYYDQISRVSRKPTELYR